jgi:hypothetical protein
MATWADYAAMFQNMDAQRLQMEQQRQQMAAQAWQQQQARAQYEQQMRARQALGNALPQLLASPPPQQQQPAPQAPNPGQQSVPMAPPQQLPQAGPQTLMPPLPPGMPPGMPKGPAAGTGAPGVPPYRPMPTTPTPQAASSTPAALSAPPAPQQQPAPQSGPISWPDAIALLQKQGLSGADLFEGLQQLQPILDTQAKQQLAVSQAQFKNELQMAQLQERYDALKQRAEDSALNRADREQAHADSVALRQQMMDLHRQSIMLRTNGSPDSELSGDDLKFMAKQYLAAPDQSIFANLGRGAQGAKNVVRLRQAIMSEAKEQGLSPEDVAARGIQTFGEKAGARKAGERTTNIEMAANEANQLAGQALQVSSELPRTGARDVNSALNNMRARFGDAKVAKFQVAINGFKNAYARAISPSGTPTVHDKQHADELFSMNQSPEQFNASIQQAKREMEAALRAPTDVQEAQRARISGRKAGPAVGTVEGGYRFKGGNPADPNAWEPAGGSGVPK